MSKPNPELDSLLTQAHEYYATFRAKLYFLRLNTDDPLPAEWILVATPNSCKDAHVLSEIFRINSMTMGLIAEIRALQAKDPLRARIDIAQSSLAVIKANEWII